MHISDLMTPFPMLLLGFPPIWLLLTVRLMRCYLDSGTKTLLLALTIRIVLLVRLFFMSTKPSLTQ